MSSFIEFNGELLNLLQVCFFIKEQYTDINYKQQLLERFIIKALDKDRTCLTEERFESEEKRDRRYAELKGRYLV